MTIKGQAANALIQNYYGRYLLQKQDNDARLWKNQWVIMGGGIEDGETPEECLVWEAKEETGLTALCYEFVDTFYILENGKQDRLFIVEVDACKEKLVCNEGEKMEWFTKE